MRGKTWIATTFAAGKGKERGEGLDNCRLLKSQLEELVLIPVKFPLRK